MENLSQNKKISLGIGVVLLISLFLPWASFMGLSVTLMGIAGMYNDASAIGLGADSDAGFKALLAIYMGYAFLILGAAGLFFNYKDDIQKAKWAYYSMLGYFVLIIILNISEMGEMGEMGGGDGPSIFSILGIGFYVFIASFIGTFKFLKEENNPEVIE
jgi:hypothetical protein